MLGVYESPLEPSQEVHVQDFLFGNRTVLLFAEFELFLLFSVKMSHFPNIYNIREQNSFHVMFVLSSVKYQEV